MGKNILKMGGAFIAMASMFFCELSAADGVAGGDGKGAARLVVSQKNPRWLELSDGSGFVPVGVNFCFPRGEDMSESACVERVERQMKLYSDNGVNFIRIWVSNDFYDFETAEGVYPEEKFKHLDMVVELAQRYNIRLKFCLEHFREISPKRDTFFTKTIYSKANGGSFDSIEDFYKSPKGREVYLNRAAQIAKRYGDNPYVSIIEVWNENDSVKVSLPLIAAWTKAILPELKKMFPDKIVVQNLGSYCSDWSDEHYKALMNIEGNELAQVHRYLDLGARWEICHAPMDELAADAVAKLRAMAPNRPVLLAETGAVKPNHTGPFELYEKDTDGVLLHDEIFAPFFAGACGCGQAWHWDSYIERNNLHWHYGRFVEAIKGINPLEEDFRPLRMDVKSTKNARMYALDGKTMILVWVRDTLSDWQSQLRDGKPAQLRTDVRIRFADLLSDTPRRVEFFDPWTGEHRNVVTTGGSAVLPPFKRSCVIKIIK